MKARTAVTSRSSFTLVEMLTAIAVLSILMVIIFSIVGSALRLSDSTGRSADSAIEARQVLDRIGADITGMLNRPDVDQFYYTGPGVGNDKMFFYSQQAGYFPTTDTATIAYYAANQSPFSLVGYRINTTDAPAGLPKLERLARGLTVDADGAPNGAATSPMQYLTFNARTSATGPVTLTTATGGNGSITNQWGTSGTYPDVGSSPYDNGASTYYGTIGSQVFRFKICFQLANGTFSSYPGYTNSAPVYPASIKNTVAIVVAIAVLDSRSRKLVPASSWATLRNSTTLPDPQPTDLNNSPPHLMDYLWNNALQQSSFATTAQIPAIAAAKIKVYQRYYYLNAPKAQ